MNRVSPTGNDPNLTHRRHETLNKPLCTVKMKYDKIYDGANLDIFQVRRYITVEMSHSQNDMSAIITLETLTIL